MKFKVNLFICLLYLAAFSNVVMEVAGIDKSLNSFVLLSLDVGIIYLGLTSFNTSKINKWTFFLIIIIAFLNYMSHEYSFITYINGLRELINIVLVFVFLEALAKSTYSSIFNIRFKRFMKIFLIAQIPITFYQFFLYGAGDEVGGSMGIGNSGILTLIIVMMLFVVIKHEKVNHGIKAYYNLIFLIPLFLNETKISFLLVPLLFLSLTEIKKFMPTVISICSGVLFFILFNSLYSDRGKTSENPFKDIFNTDYLELYLLNEAQVGGDVPRFTKIVLATKLLNQNIPDFILGMETGAFRGGNVIGQSAFSKRNEWLLSGSRPYIFYLLINGGVALLILLIYFVLHKLYSNKKANKDYKFIFLLTSIFIVILFYNDAFRSQIFLLTFTYFLLVAKGNFHGLLNPNIKDYRTRKDRRLPLFN